MTFNSKSNHHRHSDSGLIGLSGNGPEDDDKSSLEAAAEAAAKVNAMLIAKGMLKPNQLHSGIHNVVTKKIGGPNSLMVAEVEINYLSLPCRNTLTRGTTQEEISKASGASVTTRGRYMTDDDRARNPRDRCLYLNIQASKKESVDVAVQKINEIIKSMGGDKMNNLSHHGGGRFRSPTRPNFNTRFGAKNQNNGPPPQHHHHQQQHQHQPPQHQIQHQPQLQPQPQQPQLQLQPQHQPPPPLMSLPSLQQLQQPPPQLSQMQQVIPQLHLPPPPPATIQVTVVQEKLYVGLEHAPPNFDTKNKLLGPGGSFLQHISTETGCNVSLRGKGSGFMDLSGADAFEPMHVRIEHSSLVQLQEGKRLAENLIQTVQRSYVSFQQALAALPPSMPTGLITGVPQQTPMLEHHQFTMAQSGLATIATVHEQSLQALQPQALTNTAAPPSVVIPSSMTLQMPMVGSLAVSAAPQSIVQQQAPPLDLVCQQPMLISAHPHQGGPPPPPQAMLQQVVPTAQPQPVPPPGSGGGPPLMATAYATIQQPLQLVSQAPPPTMVQQPAPTMMAQPPPQICPPQPMSSLGVSLAGGPTSVVYTTMASSTGHTYYSSLKDGDEAKRRFREEKDDKIPDNLLGYQHGPPHLVNLVRSSPPPQPPQPVPPPPMSQGLSTQLIQQPPQGVVMSHLPPPGLDQGQFAAAHMGGGQPAFFHQPGQVPMVPPPPHEGGPPLPPHPHHHPHHLQHPPPPHQLLSQPSPFVSGPPPHHYLPPPMSSMATLSPSCLVTSSPSPEMMRPHSRNDKSLMPPPPPPSGLGSPGDEENKEESKNLDETKENGGKRKSNGYSGEPEKKKIKGILKNKQEKPPEGDQHGEDRGGHPDQSAGEDDPEKHPASPQYQGQPLRYPSMASDPNIPPQLQDMGMHGPRPPHPGHHLVQPLDPNNLPPQMHHPQPHMHPEGPPRPDGPQIMIEHAIPHGAPIHITHHRPPGPPTSIHMEQHQVPGAPFAQRQIFLEHHPHPPPTPQHLEQHLGQPPLHHEQLQQHQHPAQQPQPPQGVPMHAQPPPHQEVLEYEVHPSRLPPPFPSFESIPVSALSQQDPQQQAALLQQGQTVMTVSSAPHYIPYSIATISSQAAPPPPQASFAPAGHTYSQPLQQQQPQQQQQQMMAAPPPVPPSSYSIAMPPTSSPHFQAQFSHHPHHPPPQSVQGHALPPPPPSPMPVASQPQFHQPHPQGIHYLTS